MALDPGLRRADLHAQNLSAIVRILRRSGPLARFQLAEQTGLTRGAISTLCGELRSWGLLTEVGSAERAAGSRGGPNPILLDLDPAARLAVGIQFSKKRVRVGLVDLKGHVVSARDLPLQGDGRSAPQEAVAMAAAAANSLVAASRARDRVLGVGVGAPGVVDSESGIAQSDPYMGWHGVPLREWFESRLALPVVVDHNVRAMALAELRYGAGSEVDSFLEVYWSTGIGSGIAIRGELYTGGAPGDGQLGHTVADPDGPACVCGNRGCLETFAGEDALVAEFGAPAATGGQDADIDTVIDAAQAGDTGARRVLDRAARRVGMACANLINVLGPLAVVAGGPVARAGEHIIQPLRETLAGRLHPWIRDRVSVRLSALGDDLGLVGAASLALEALFFSESAPIWHQGTGRGPRQAGHHRAAAPADAAHGDMAGR
ncbi:MAG: ROK family protein [Bacillota bacterium]